MLMGNKERKENHTIHTAGRGAKSAALHSQAIARRLKKLLDIGQRLSDNGFMGLHGVSISVRRYDGRRGTFTEPLRFTNQETRSADVASQTCAADCRSVAVQTEKDGGQLTWTGNDIAHVKVVFRKRCEIRHSVGTDVTVFIRSHDMVELIRLKICTVVDKQTVNVMLGNNICRTIHSENGYWRMQLSIYLVRFAFSQIADETFIPIFDEADFALSKASAVQPFCVRVANGRISGPMQEYMVPPHFLSNVNE